MDPEGRREVRKGNGKPRGVTAATSRLTPEDVSGLTNTTKLSNYHSVNNQGDFQGQEAPNFVNPTRYDKHSNFLFIGTIKCGFYIHRLLC